MHFNALPLLATVLAVAQQASTMAVAQPVEAVALDSRQVIPGGNTCYTSGGTWGNAAQKTDARNKLNDWCNQWGGVTYGKGQQAKSCVGYSNGKIMFRIKNGHNGDKYLDKADCRATVGQFISSCEHGGYNDVVVGWRGRADPGSGCD